MGLFKRRKKDPLQALEAALGAPGRLAENAEFRDGQPAGTPRWTETASALALPAPPEPENMQLLSDEAIVLAMQDVGVVLNLTPESLSDVDAILSNFSAEGSEAWAAPTFMFGAYVGEVMVEHLEGARWGRHEMFGEIPVVLLESGRVENPVMKAFKRVEDGEADSVAFFYEGAAASQD